MAEKVLISKSELLKEFDPNGDMLDRIFVRSKIVFAEGVSEQEIRNKAIDDMKSAWDSRVKDLIKWCKDKRLSGLEQADLIFGEIAEEMKGAEKDEEN